MFHAGLFIATSDATADHVLVRGTRGSPADNLFGDGLAVFAQRGTASATIAASRIEGSARANVSSFGADVKLSSTTLECGAIHLDGESFKGAAAMIEDLGGNSCGCGGVTVVCQVLSSNLTPPDAIPPPP